MVAYDKIADQYKQRAVLPIHRHVRQHTFSQLVVDVTGKSVLDLACGDGYYTRCFKPDAVRVVGADISEKVVDFARKIEEEKPLGIEYLVCDVAERTATCHVPEYLCQSEGRGQISYGQRQF